MKKILCILLALVTMLPVTVPVYAEGNPCRTVIGADLNEEQIEAVYGMFGVRRGDVVELRVTNAEERQTLQGYVDESVIGTRSISCVYVELLPENSGLEVTTGNVSWCTSQMYISALATAGITDARIVVAAPFEVSGTAALTGIYKAYEDMTGQKMDDSAKQAGTQELTTTGELANEIGSTDSTSIVNDLKQILDETQNMSDEEIRQEIVQIAERYNVRLTETQIRQLIDLCRTMEGLSPDELRQRVEDVQETLHKVSEAKDKVVGFAETVKKVIDSITDFFDRVSAVLDKFK